MSFDAAFEEVLTDEGGYKLTDIPGDAGGQTYAGIARRPNPDWIGWAYIDRKEIPPQQLVKDFYRQKFWNDIQGDKIANSKVAASIFNFYVNTGNPAKTLAQTIVGAEPDGIFGNKTIQSLNAYDSDKFILAYALAKVRRYANICNHNREQTKFLLGWINRTLRF